VELSAQQIIDLLGLKPHPTCGFASEIFQSAIQVPKAVLPAGYNGSRPLGGVLYFLVKPEAQIRLHRIRSDQMYHHYFGDPLEVLLLYPNGISEVKTVGPDLAAGMRPQLMIPGNTYHASRMAPGAKFAMLGTSVWVKPEPSDVEMGNPDQLAVAYPAAKSQIMAFAQPPA
jgi:uncharacterized protein